VFSLSHCKFSLPQIKGAITLQYPTARVCFLRVTTLIPFPWIEGLTTHPSYTYITLLYDASPQQTTMTFGSGGEYGCGPELWEEQDPEFKGAFQSCKRGTSVPCVKLEATHITNRCCGQHVHTVSVA
jgi:hypothetical protein